MRGRAVCLLEGMMIKLMVGKGVCEKKIIAHGRLCTLPLLPVLLGKGSLYPKGRNESRRSLFTPKNGPKSQEIQHGDKPSWRFAHLREGWRSSRKLTYREPQRQAREEEAKRAHQHEHQHPSTKAKRRGQAQTHEYRRTPPRFCLACAATPSPTAHRPPPPRRPAGQ